MTEYPTVRVCPNCGGTELGMRGSPGYPNRLYCGECGRAADDYDDWEERPARLPDRISAFLAGLWGKSGDP